MEKLTAIVYTGLYVLILAGFIAMAVLSYRERLPQDTRDPPPLYMRPFRRMAVWLYRKLVEYRARRRQKGKILNLPGEEGVRNDLQILYPSLKAGRQEILYHLKKTEKLLALLFAGVLLAGSLHVRSLFSGIVQENGQIPRAEVGGSDRSVRLKALSPETDADSAQQGDYGTYTVTVHARQYTREEAQKEAQTILQQFPRALLGENISEDQIRTPLVMPSSEDTAPFSLNWERSRYAVLDIDGSIFNSEYTEQQAEEVELTAVLSYGDYRFQKKMTFVVRAPQRNEEDLRRREIDSTLTDAERKSASRRFFVLPSGAGQLSLIWEEEVEDVSAGVLILGIVSCIMAWYVMDYRLHERIRERSRQMAIDYPQLTSKMVLYLEAGMSVRNIFYKCGSEYLQKMEKQIHKSGKKPCVERCLYEEIVLVCNELDSGIPEAEAYMHFGRRCRSRQYTKLCTLLVQNLRRGNDTLLQVLQEEAQNSFEERKNLAREMGEEAGTRLLLPMMIMLAVTMLIIIVPAYFSFSI